MEESSGRLNILFLSQRFLMPMDTGGKIRTGKILTHLKDLASLTVISNVERPKDEQYLPEMKTLCDKFISVPWKESRRYTMKFYLKIALQSLSRYPISVLNDYSTELERSVYDELQKGSYDIAICDFLQSTLNFRRINGIPTLLFQHNVESAITKRHLEKAKNPISVIFWWLQHRRMFRHEKAMCNRFSGTIAVSEKDKHFMEKSFKAGNVFDIPTGVDTEFYKPQNNVKAKKQLVFTGSMDWLPNEDAMIYFIQRIFPLIKAEEPSTSLIIVGRQPTPGLLKLTKDRNDITTTGWVEDTRPYIEDSAVFIVPIRIGGGTRMKIYEALSMGKAVVSTTVGAEGLPLTHEEHILFADKEQDFADNAVKLLRDEELRRSLGATARKYVYDHFRWEKVATIFKTVCEDIIKVSTVQKVH